MAEDEPNEGIQESPGTPPDPSAKLPALDAEPTDSEQQSPEPGKHSPERDPQPFRRKLLIGLIAAAAVALVLLVGGAALLLIGDADSGDSNTDGGITDVHTL